MKIKVLYKRKKKVGKKAVDGIIDSFFFPYSPKPHYCGYLLIFGLGKGGEGGGLRERAAST